MTQIPRYVSCQSLTVNNVSYNNTTWNKQKAAYWMNEEIIKCNHNELPVWNCKRVCQRVFEKKSSQHMIFWHLKKNTIIW